MRITKKYNMPLSGDLVGDIRLLIETARHNVAVTVNAGLTILYWQIGNRIRQDILKEKRARYGEEILPTLSAKLAVEYGRGFSRRNLFNMIRFAEVFTKELLSIPSTRSLFTILWLFFLFPFTSLCLFFNFIHPVWKFGL